MESIYDVAGRKVQIFRAAKGLTQMELAEKSDLSVSFVSQIETGHKKASLDGYYKIANGLGIQLSELFKDPEVVIKRMRKISFKNLSSQQKIYFDKFLKSL